MMKNEDKHKMRLELEEVKAEISKLDEKESSGIFWVEDDKQRTLLRLKKHEILDKLRG